MNDRRLLWRRHSTIESFDSSTYQSIPFRSPVQGQWIPRMNKSPSNDLIQLDPHNMSEEQIVKCSTGANSADTSPCGTPPISRLFSYPYFDIFQQQAASKELAMLYNRPRSCTVGEVAFQRNLQRKRPSQLIQLPKHHAGYRETGSSTTSAIGGGNHRSRRLSVRQSIFHKVVVTPKLLLNRHSVASVNTLFEDTESEQQSAYSSHSSPSSPKKEDFNKNAAFYRAMWKKIIVFQIESHRDENKRLLEELKSRSEFKLNYEEIIGCSQDEQRTIWKAMLNHPNRSSTRFDRVQLEEAVKTGDQGVEEIGQNRLNSRIMIRVHTFSARNTVGVHQTIHFQNNKLSSNDFSLVQWFHYTSIPKDMRGDVWLFLIEQHTLDKSRRTDSKEPTSYRYSSLTKELSSYQHAILIDLGRTFPCHPYFVNPLGAGQLSLLNILKAYSIYDPEVGYCQGLSFVAGLLLLHMEEEQAFSVLVDLLYRFDMRKQYKPDMLTLQIEMYQLSRLLSDKHKDLHDHLEKYEIPSLYAAPWFLTLFASAFPLNFVARVFDFVLLSGGLDVVFKIALVLLGNHKELIKQCNSFESINDFLKLTLPSMSYIQMERIFNQVAEMDISKELLGYEVEYHVLDEEMFSYEDSMQPNLDVAIAKLEADNKTLKRQNMDLLEKLQQAHSKVAISENEQKELEVKLESSLNTINSYKCKLVNLERCIETLELERKSLLTAVQRMKSRVPLLGESEMFLSCDIPSSMGNTNKLVRFYSNDDRSSTAQKQEEKKN